MLTKVKANANANDKVGILQNVTRYFIDIFRIDEYHWSTRAKRLLAENV